MARIVRRSFGFGGKLVFMLFLALVAGFLWAMADSGRSFADVAKILSPSAPAPAAPAPVAPTAGPKVKVDPTEKPVPAAPAAPVAPLRPAAYSMEKMDSLFEELATHLRRGRIREANELLRRQDVSLVPASRMDEFRKSDTEVGRYIRLLGETIYGAAVDLPQIAELDLRSGGAIVVKNLQESPVDVRFETLTGIRSTLKKSDVTAIRRSTKEMGGVLVDEELEKQASYRGVRIAKTGVDWAFGDGPKGSVPGYSFFELADFCARNGRNQRVVPLFAEGLKRDPNLAATVFEKKAAQFVDILLYFIAIQSKEDAQRTYDVLKRRYGLSKAYRERVENDQEVRKMFADLFDTEVAQGPKSEAPKTEDPAPSPEP